MEETKNLCAKIPVALHQKIREKQEKSGLKLNEYVAKIITEYYEREGGAMSQEKTRTLALQMPEELFERLKVHLKEERVSQKAFIIKLIEDALQSKQQ